MHPPAVGDPSCQSARDFELDLVGPVAMMTRAATMIGVGIGATVGLLGIHVRHLARSSQSPELVSQCTAGTPGVPHREPAELNRSIPETIRSGPRPLP
jgi:hypothetical protein